MRWALLLIAACGSAPTTKVELETQLVTVASNHDVAGLRTMLRDSVVNGGIWFPDAQCTREFVAPGEIKGPRLDDFARCLAQLGLTHGTRGDALPDVVVVSYAPGFELEARVIDTTKGPWLAWIGFASRRSFGDALPTISNDALESLRAAGDRTMPATPELDHDASVAKFAFAWLKVCIDAAGTVTSVHVRSASSPGAARAMSALPASWQFRPFMLGTQALPVCAMTELVYPPDAKPDEQLPVPLPAMPKDLLFVGLQWLGSRVTGDTFMTPSDQDKVLIQSSSVRRIIGSYLFCIDEAGKVDTVHMIRSTGVQGYDDKLTNGIRRWSFQPFLDRGVPVALCSSATFIYSQR